MWNGLQHVVIIYLIWTLSKSSIYPTLNAYNKVIHIKCSISWVREKEIFHSRHNQPTRDTSLVIHNTLYALFRKCTLVALST